MFFILEFAIFNFNERNKNIGRQPLIIHGLRSNFYQWKNFGPHSLRTSGILHKKKL